MNSESLQMALNDSENTISYRLFVLGSMEIFEFPILFKEVIAKLGERLIKWERPLRCNRSQCKELGA